MYYYNFQLNPVYTITFVFILVRLKKAACLDFLSTLVRNFTRILFFLTHDYYLFRKRFTSGVTCVLRRPLVGARVKFVASMKIGKQVCLRNGIFYTIDDVRLAFSPARVSKPRAQSGFPLREPSLSQARLLSRLLQCANIVCV